MINDLVHHKKHPSIFCKDGILKKVSLYSAPRADSSCGMRQPSDSGLDICLLVSFHFGAKLTSIMPCEAAAATATELPEGQVFLHHFVTENAKGHSVTIC